MFKEEIWAPVFFPHGQKLLKKGKNESSEFNYQALSCEGQLWKMKCKIRLFVILLMRLKSLLLKNTKWDLLELTGVFILPVCISRPYKSAGWTSKSRNSFFHEPWMKSMFVWSVLHTSTRCISPGLLYQLIQTRVHRCYGSQSSSNSQWKYIWRKGIIKDAAHGLLAGKGEEGQ